MTGNDETLEGRWYPHAMLIDAGDTPCDVCGGHLPDHAWAVLVDEAGTVVVADCGGTIR